MGRNRKNKLEWFSSFKSSFDEAIEIKAKKEPEQLESYLRDAALSSVRVLNDASERGIINELAVRYAHGDTILNTNTQESREEYLKVLHHEWLPSYWHRRIFDATTARIKDLLKGFALRIVISELIQENPDMDDGEIASLLYQRKKSKELGTHIGYVKHSYVKNIRKQMAKNGNELPQIKPVFKPKLQLSQMDTFSSVRRIDEETCVLSFSCGQGKAEMTFAVPSKTDYATGKICKPDILLSSEDDDSRVVFNFSISHNAISAYEPICSLGVDVGAIYPFTCGVIGDDWYSQIVYPNSEIMQLVDKINELQRQKNDLLNDLDEDERKNRTPHIEAVLERKTIEKDRLSDKISRMKKEVARLSANRVVDIAYQAQAEIVLEELAWSTPSHYFFYKEIHDAIENLAHKRGVKVRNVSAKDTSRIDPVSGARVSQGVRVNAPVTAGKRQYLAARTSNAYGVTTRGCKVESTERVKQHDGVSPLNIGRRGYARLRGGRVRTLASKRQVRLCFRRLCWSGATEPAAGSESTDSSVPVFRDGTTCEVGASLIRASLLTKSPLAVSDTQNASDTKRTQETKIA